MRWEGKAKLGFFPLPVAEAKRVRNLLRFPDGKCSAIDPCVGDGVAFAAIANMTNVTRYGIELDSFRAEQAKTLCDEVIQGNALEVFCPVHSCSLLYENPPYDWEIGTNHNRRLEYAFLKHTYRWLKPAGVLLLVIPVERIDECSQILAEHFRDVRVYQLTAADSRKYRQVAVIGIRRSQREHDKVQDSAIVREREHYASLASNPDRMPALQEEPECAYDVPESGPVQLTYRGLPLDLIEDLLPKSPAYRQAAPVLLGYDEQLIGRPLTPLHGGHVGLLCTAGMLNGIFGQDDSRHIAHWQTVKVVDKREEENENGTVTITERERFANELNLAFANGRVRTLK